MSLFCLLAPPGAWLLGVHVPYSRPSKVLVVDDDSDITHALEVGLRGANVDVVTANSGADAIARFAEGEFACAFVDIMMPGMSGLELVAKMRESFSSRFVPVVFMTGFATLKSDAAVGYESGAVDYLVKPVDLSVLRHKVQVFVELDQIRRLLSDRGERNASAIDGGLWERGGICLATGTEAPFYVSPGWLLSTLGYESTSDFSGNWESVIRQDCLAGWTEAYRRLVEGSDVSVKLDLVAIRKDGSDCHLRGYLSSAPTGFGSSRRVFGQFIDMTTQLADEGALAVGRARYVYGAKIGMLSDVAEGASHDIRDPLFMMRASVVRLGQIIKSLPDSEVSRTAHAEIADAMGVIDQSAADIEAVVGRLNVFQARRDRSTISLSAILRGLETLLFDRMSTSDVRLDTSNVPHDVGVYCHQDRLIAAMLMVFDTVYDAGRKAIRPDDLQKIDGGKAEPEDGLVRVETDIGDGQVTVRFSYVMANSKRLMSLAVVRGLHRIRRDEARCMAIEAASRDAAKEILSDYDGAVSYVTVDNHAAALMTLPVVDLGSVGTVGQ